ncbi:hypothetical protein L873DRAFT_1815614 [Choiromyces venosus 120613-1]|uniref:Uncharacterized protein n=1 Tax=Choiromyces venosus 120613-1 TaxID=1336337 RepID=A0A3N4J8L7_9PEZI|nr:hypothetical protein L873DRAFT_1815614 [Choiromyces venosus 120613-1]
MYIKKSNSRPKPPAALTGMFSLPHSLLLIATMFACSQVCHYCIPRHSERPA